jgi:hypothetical protein
VTDTAKGCDSIPCATVVQTERQTSVISDDNPFDPRLSGVPLQFTLDGRSLATTEHGERKEMLYLLTLARSPVLDVLVLDAPDGFADDLDRGYTDDPDLERDHRVIRQVGSEQGFWGGITPWSSRVRRADEMGLDGPEREWFLYYETTTWFNRNTRRRFFVTADSCLLGELRAKERHGLWSGRNIIDMRHAFKMLGWVMRRRDMIYLEAQPGYTSTTSNYAYCLDVAFWLAPDQLRLRHWAHDRSEDARESPLWDLVQSVHARLVDLLKARDGVAFAWLRHQNNATLDDILYHLRNAIPTATALFDALATLAQRALNIDASSIGGINRVSLGDRDFRKALRTNKAAKLADEAARCGPLWKMLSVLRNPIIHGPGLAGVGFQKVPGPSESRLTLVSGQAEKVEATAQWAGEDIDSWGLHHTGYEPLLEPLLFVERLTSVVVRAADRLVIALADALDAPSAHHLDHGDDLDRLWKFGLLGGLVPELAAAGAPPWTPDGVSRVG